jgi:hypothetical protein
MAAQQILGITDEHGPFGMQGKDHSRTTGTGKMRQSIG